ncbi:hypothetical protein ALO95_200403 [Pseudomonas syringae pv. antirrhini]|nr:MULTISPECIES: MBL fold metallo-hydrolase [Pseudomonas]RMP42518.1 hypothetical protein ALQ23_200093 [Pseudomonas syringae pv. antirrhini]RMW23496.1 hypothetical protein ALO95_200403 [Pseudomonas syringae pv. antirrhini]WIN08833.1 MBL fold metallo-hydrolase [Pseudomonas syringae pv. antirrhini str. 126]
MIFILKRVLLIFLAVTAVLAAIIYGYLQAPLFGALPNGAVLERIRHSPNAVNDTFQNQVETPIHTAGSTEMSIWKDMLFGEKGHPRPPAPIPTQKVDLKALDRSQDQLVWLGHSSFFIQMNGQRILIDPVLSTNAAPIPYVNEAFEGASPYSSDDLPDIDLLLISHDHYDHLDYPTIKSLRPKIHAVVAGLGVGAHFRAWGYDTSQIHEVDWYEEVGMGGGLAVSATPARHFSGRGLEFNKSLWVGFVLTTSRHRLFFSGDTGYGPHIAEIARRYGPFDWVALDTGQYDPRWANVHMNPEQAALAAEELHTRVFIPEHVGRFSLAPHDWDDPFKRVSAASAGKDYVLFTPLIGQLIHLDRSPPPNSPWWEGVNPIHSPFK